MLELTCIIPTLNSAKTLEVTLTSLVNQSDVKVHIIVVDSGSQDGTREICHKFGLTPIYHPPGNMYSAINAGIQHCTTEWVTYLNSDDYMYTDSYQRLLTLASANNADIVYGNHDFIDGEGRFLCSIESIQPKHILALFRAGELGFIQPAVIYKYSLYQQLNGFDQRYTLCADGDFFIRAVLHKAHYRKLKGAPVVAFRMHLQQQTQKKWNLMQTEKQAIAQTLVSTPSWRDKMHLISYRLTNLPNYAVRLLRVSQLTQRIQFRITE